MYEVKRKDIDREREKEQKNLCWIEKDTKNYIHEKEGQKHK